MKTDKNNLAAARVGASAIKAAADMLSVDAIPTLRFSASGATFSVGQKIDPLPRNHDRIGELKG